MDVQHTHTNRERALGLHAIPFNSLVIHHIAVLGYVPRCAVVLALGINGIGGGLGVD
jgi:hypothetical protein